MKRAVSVDGSVLEGGGQILRVSIALSSLLSIPLEIKNIRGNRPKPGLAAQHLTSVNAASVIVNGELEGCEFRSSTLSFTPNSSQNVAKITHNSFSFEVGTAGAVSLVIQAMLPGFLFGARDLTCCPRVDVIGGTNVAFSPPIDHTIHVLLPLLCRMGIPTETECRIVRRGWNPSGGGQVSLYSPTVTSVGAAGLSLSPTGTPGGQDRVLGAIDLAEAGTPVVVRGVICSNTDNAAVMEAGRSALLHMLRDPQHQALFPAGIPVDIDIDVGQSENQTARSVFRAAGSSNSRGSDNHCGGGGGGGSSKGGSKSCEVSIQLWVETTTGCRLSRNVLQNLKKPTPAAMAAVCEKLFSALVDLVASGATVDEHTADQLLVFMALANAPSRLLVEPHDSAVSSLHIETSIFIVEKFLRCKVFDMRAVGAGGAGCRLITCTPVPVSMN